MTKAFVDNASDEKQIEAAGKKEKFFEDQKLDDIKEVLSTEAGRRFVWRMLDFCGVFKSSLADEHMIYFNEGIRNVGLRLLEDITLVGLDAYMLILKENQEND